MKGKLKQIIGTVLIVLCIFSTGCTAKQSKQQSEKVDATLKVSILATDEKGEVLVPDSVLMEETVKITEINCYDDGEITVPFNFSDVSKYANLMESNIGRRIAIAINGEVVYTPVVKMRLDNGACSVLLTKEQAENYFPQKAIDNVLSAH